MELAAPGSQLSRAAPIPIRRTGKSPISDRSRKRPRSAGLRGPPGPEGVSVITLMQQNLTRRALLAGSAATALTGCRDARPIVPSQVSVVRATAYDQRLYDIVRRLLAEHRLDVRGRRILLKPNLVEFEPESSINTNPLLVHAAFEAFRSMGASSVLIAEGPGHRRNTLDLAEAAGYFKIVPGFEDRFVDLNLDDVARIRPSRQFSRLEKLYLPHSALS